jgi:hypothetical protein
MKALPDAEMTAITDTGGVAKKVGRMMTVTGGETGGGEQLQPAKFPASVTVLSAWRNRTNVHDACILGIKLSLSVVSPLSSTPTS